MNLERFGNLKQNLKIQYPSVLYFVIARSFCVEYIPSCIHSELTVAIFIREIREVVQVPEEHLTTDIPEPHTFPTGGAARIPRGRYKSLKKKIV